MFVSLSDIFVPFIFLDPNEIQPSLKRQKVMAPLSIEGNVFEQNFVYEML